MLTVEAGGRAPFTVVDSGKKIILSTFDITLFNAPKSAKITIKMNELYGVGEETHTVLQVDVDKGRESIFSQGYSNYILSNRQPAKVNRTFHITPTVWGINGETRVSITTSIRSTTGPLIDPNKIGLAGIYFEADVDQSS